MVNSNKQAIVAQLTFVLIFIGNLSIAQSLYEIDQYTVAHGLDSDYARGMCQDSLGLMWFDHDSHISRFDEYKFKIFRHDPDDSLMNLGLPLIGRLQSDKYGNLWINNLINHNARQDILKYDFKTEGFIRIQPSVQHYINWIAADQNKHRLWLGARFGGGLYEYNQGTGETRSHLNENDKDNLLLNNHISIIEDQGDNLLLSTKNGLWNYSKSKHIFYRPHLLNSQDSSLFFSGWVIKIPQSNWVLLQNSWVLLKVDSLLNIKLRIDLPTEIHNSDFAIDKQDVIWFLNQKGVFRYEYARGNIKTIYDNTTNQHHLSEITIDRNDNVWFTSETGIRKINRPDFEYYISKTIDTHKSRTDYIQLYKQGHENYSLVLGGRDFNNALWTAPIKLENSELTPISFDGQHDHPANLVSSNIGKNYIWIAAYSRGVIGIGYDSISRKLNPNNVVYYSREQGNPYTLSCDSTINVYEDKFQNLWVTTAKGLNKIDLKMKYGSVNSVHHYYNNPYDTNTINFNAIDFIVPEDESSFWVSTSVGVDLFKNGKFHHVFKGRERVGCIGKSKKGFLYVGTGGGLYTVNNNNGKYSIKKTIVTEDVDIGFIEDNYNRLWISSRKGLLLFDPEKNIVVNFSNQKTLSNTGGFAKTQDGIIAVTLNDAIITFDPQKFNLSNTESHTILTSLKINNRIPITGNRSVGTNDFKIPSDIKVLNDLTLDYLHNNFSLEFSSVEMIAPQNILYRYKLDGYDQDWIITKANNRTVTYTNLSAGQYTFRVESSNHHGVWSNNQRILKLTILPPPWKTWWAYSLYGFLVIGLLYWARTNIVQRERLKTTLKVKQLEHEKEHYELEKAKEVNRVKTSFFTNISHEFRTPLTMILVPVEHLIEKYKNDLNTLNALNIIKRNADLLLKLINQLLDLSKLESGALQIEKSEGNPYQFVRAIASSFDSIASQKNIYFKIDIPEDNCIANFDKNKLETILINLIYNAIKFTPNHGKVQIRARIENNQLILSVIDSGIGIPKHQVNRIFEKFYQTNNIQKDFGTGIGLSLVKELVTLMKGTIVVKSKVGKGSVFQVRLPLELSESHINKVEISTLDKLPTLSYPLQAADNGTHKDQNNKATLLIVEDNRDLRMFIVDFLASEFNLIEAQNGKVGLSKATSEIPDLIISDVMMPEMDGIQMLSKIKMDIRTSHIPVILLTAKTVEESKLIGLQAGADDYLIKPFNRSELLLKIRNKVSSITKIREHIKLELLKESPKIKVKSADEQFLIKVKEIIHQRLADEQLSVESLADEMGLSRVQLYRKITALTGFSCNELIRVFRLQKAAQLLDQNWGPITQVAYEVGFSNLSYFSKAFKEQFGVLPSEYINGKN